MILDAHQRARANADGPGLTLDDLFRRAAIRRPQAVALCDPANREAFTGTPARSLTYVQIDNAASALAARLRALGLRNDTVVAYQLPNTVESIVTLLGILRAGMIAAPLPLLWRADEIAMALARCGATMLIGMTRIGAVDHRAIALQAAAAHFPLRHVGLFGTGDHDGTVPFDDVLTAPSAAFAIGPRAGDAAAHVAIVTFESWTDGPVAVARSHRQFEAAAAALPANTPGAMLTTVALSSFAGLSLALLPWLMGDMRLVLHHAFDLPALQRQREEHRCATLIVPGSAREVLTAAGAFAPGNGLQRIVSLWRAPAMPQDAPAQPDIAHVNVTSIGEFALDPAPLMVRRTPAGTLALGGDMVPTGVFPPGADRSSPHVLSVGDDGMVETGYACPDDRGSLAAAAPRGLVTIGGYRLNPADLAQHARPADPQATVVALPHALLGNRLAGTAANPASAQAALAERHPLLADAFRTPRTAA
ncbi:MAG: AMP-binding protein [Pseudolabrys sp.]|nr:AMP-binding protein [Pseudolabrys sp.]